MKPAAQIDLYFPALAPGRILGRAFSVYRQRGFRLLQDHGLGTAVLGLVLFALGRDIRGVALALALPAIAVYLATAVTLTGRCMLIRLVGEYDMALGHRVVLPAGALGLVQAATVAACLGLAIAAESTLDAQLGPLAGAAGSAWVLLARALATGASALLLCRWQVAVPTMVAERVGPLAALRRSWQLTRG